ncbi:Protein kinase domain-containing protein [Caenorhabditis elegans]|nr:Protein kinase domain-containing protein [Caenorhabditis elegans]CAH10788.1 Protein kinase domain-containing protein [Caenorhabditis elegans]|eukprot:NP_001022386.1 Uncharacterized protein CELE_W02B12.12 [Caenorhabditis elegans]
MTSEEPTRAQWSSREDRENQPPMPGSMYTKHSTYSTSKHPTTHTRTSYMPSKSSQHHHPASSSHHNHHRKRSDATKRYAIEDFRQAFARKGMDLDTSNKLGRGKYSKVYKAFDRNNNRVVAVKAIDTQELTTDVKMKFLPRELSCWRKLKNPFVVGLHAQYEAQSMIFLTMEYGSQGDLLRYVQEHGGIHEQKAGLFMSQLIRGLQFMHSINIAHRDIKLENIILFDNCVKLSDFGFVRKMDESALSSTFCGSKSYSAPELLRGIVYNPFLSDVWSLGVVGFVMVTNRMPFDEKKPNNVIVELQRNRQYVIPHSVFLSTSCISSFESMMAFDTRNRPTSTDCLALPWITPHIVMDRHSG